MSKNIYYWRNALGDYAKFSPYQEKINQLLRGEHERLSLEKLQGTTNPPLYSIRLNKKARLLFTTYKGSILARIH